MPKIDVSKTRPLLSVIVNYCEKDSMHLETCLSTLPDWAEIIVGKHVNREDSNDYEIMNEANKGAIKHFEFYADAETFDFAKARNLTLSKATGHFVLFIDPDERLLLHQHGKIKNLLERHKKTTDTGYFITWNAGVVIAIDNEQISEKDAKLSGGSQARIFKNIPGVQFESAIHESVTPWFKRNNYRAKFTDIMIIHDGFTTTKEEQLAKLERNVKAGIRQGQYTLDNTGIYEQIIRDAYYLYKLKTEVQNGH